MWRKLSGSLTLRIFLITAALLAAACALTYAALAYLTPITYTALLEDELDAAASELIARLEQTTQAESAPELARFTQETGATAQLLLPDELEVAATEGTAGGAISEDGASAEQGVAEGDALAASDVAAPGSAEGSAFAFGDAATTGADAEERPDRAVDSAPSDISDDGNPAAAGDAEDDALASGKVAASESAEGEAFASGDLVASGSTKGDARVSCDAALASPGAKERKNRAAASSQSDIRDGSDPAVTGDAEGDALISDGAAAVSANPEEREVQAAAFSRGNIRDDSNITVPGDAEDDSFAPDGVAAMGNVVDDAFASSDSATAGADVKEREFRAAASSRGDIRDDGNITVPGDAGDGSFAPDDIAATGSAEGDALASNDASTADANPEEREIHAAASSRGDILDESDLAAAWDAESGALAFDAVTVPQVGEGDEFASIQIATEADAAADAEAGASLEGQGGDADVERRETWVAVSSEDDIGQSIRVEDGVAEISEVSYVRQEADEAAFAGDVAVARELCYEFAFRDGQRAELVVGSGLRAVNRTTEAMRRVLPYLALALLAFSLVGALVYARFITRPIVKISALAGRIANLDFRARWRGRRRDEIGALGESLNRLSDNLSGALGELQAANDRLRADIERERELERARLAFFSATSHELKTPVTILKGQLSGMLAQVGAYRDREKYLARALEVAKRMEALVQQILTVSRLESAAPVGDDAVDLSALLRRQIEQDAELIEARGLKLATEIAPNVALRGSEKLLSSALDNVLMNAILYSPPGAQIRVNLTPSSLRVFNAGARIDEADLPHLFEPFYRAEQSRSRATGGSGLGLYLVQRILELHGAKCEIKNTPEGVLFEATLLES